MQIKPYIALNSHPNDASLTDPHATWVEDLALELLEALYFEHWLLTKRPAPLLATSLVLSALFILSQNHGLFKVVPSLQKLTP